MIKNVMLFGIAFLMGCATPKGTLTTPLDYFPKAKPTEMTPAQQFATSPPIEDLKGMDEHLGPPTSETDVLSQKLDRLEKLIVDMGKKSAADEAERNKASEAIAEHNVSIAPIWSFVMNGDRAGDLYFGISLTGTTRNNLLSFKLMFTVSKDYEESTSKEAVYVPEIIEDYVPMKKLVDIRQVNRLKDFVLMPAITLPLLHYKVKFGFGSVPNIVSSVEIRTGLAYDMYIHYKHTDIFISLLEKNEKKLALPSDLREDGYVASLTTINLDFAPLHFEANFILSSKECKTALAIGVIW